MKKQRSVSIDALQRLAKKSDSDFLQVRFDYQEATQMLAQYLPHFDTDRVYPRMMPTQASGRWSIVDPPMVTIPHPEQEELVIPDRGQTWICWDLDAIEAKIVAAYSDDKADLEAFASGEDIHALTYKKMFGNSLPTDWAGKNDKRRGLAKVRYCLLYGRDWTAVKGSAYERESIKQGFKREQIWDAAKRFLISKPNLERTKRKWWDICAKTHESRTFLGRRRRLFGDYWHQAKTGWNHMIQGAVVDMLNLALIDLLIDPLYTLVYPSHDGAKISVPNFFDEEEKQRTLSLFKYSVERNWQINNHRIKSTAGWLLKFDDGQIEERNREEGSNG